VREECLNNVIRCFVYRGYFCLLDTVLDGDAMSVRDDGMSLRDWFAGQPDIVGSTLTISKEQGEALAGPRPDDPLDAFRWQCMVMASLRYIAADAMIAARKGGAA
jgi:hypothetical protein